MLRGESVDNLVVGLDANDDEDEVDGPVNDDLFCLGNVLNIIRGFVC